MKVNTKGFRYGHLRVALYIEYSVILFPEKYIGISDSLCNYGIMNQSMLRPMKTDATLLDNNTQHCWVSVCMDHNNVGTCWHLMRIA